MTDLTILRENNPAIAESIEAWRRKYQKQYDFSSVEDQALFYEGMVEMGRFVAKNSSGADLRVDVNTAGVSDVTVKAMPCAS